MDGIEWIPIEIGGEMHEVPIMGPFSLFTAPVTDLVEQLRSDGLSKPQVAVRLRRWAIQQGDVLRLTLSHTGKRYIIGVLLGEGTSERMRQANEALLFAADLFNGKLWDAYVFGPDFAHADVFHRAGTITIHDASSLACHDRGV